jgi:hypothetical protein
MPGGSHSICNAYIHCQSISKIGFSDFNRIFNGNNLFESCTVKGQKYSYGKIGFHSTANELRAWMMDQGFLKSSRRALSVASLQSLEALRVGRLPARAWRSREESGVWLRISPWIG